eukprot:jgi/Bigna1/86874/estExt_fgenesh1_pg.C_140190
MTSGNSGHRLLSDEEESLTPRDVTPLPEGTDPGLTDTEAIELYSEHGPNEIDANNGWMDDLCQGLFRLICNPLIGLLASLGILSFLTGDYSTGTVISVMALVSICLSGYHQFSAEKAARALSAGFGVECRVARGPEGKSVMTVDSKTLVPGDMVLVSAGDLIPADLQMVTASRLQVNQSILTGESVPVEKRANPDAYEGGMQVQANSGCCAANARCSNRFRSGVPSKHKFNNVLEGVEELTDDEICFMGTHVESGSAIGRVIATGERTRVGQMAESLKGLRPRSSFDRGVDGFGALMLQFTLVMCPLVFLIQTLKDGVSSEGFLYAVSVGVGLTPEMLPVVVTVCLALGAMQLSRSRGVIVKHLDSLPTLGQLNVLCVDKTGTLTRDAARVELSLTLRGRQDGAALRLARMHSLHQTGIQNAVEKAVLEAEEEGGGTNPTRASKNPLSALRPDAKLTNVHEWPFDFDRRRASVLLQPEGGLPDSSSSSSSSSPKALLVMKGAPSEVMAVCARFFISSQDGGRSRSNIFYNDDGYDRKSGASGQQGECTLSEAMGGQTAPLDAKARARAEMTLKEWEKQGLRPIAVAGVSGDPKHLRAMGEEGASLTLFGFLFLADPPKSSAAAAIASLQRMGVSVKVLTGDSPEVTKHVCEQVGLLPPTLPPSARSNITTRTDSDDDDVVIGVHDHKEHRVGGGGGSNSTSAATTPSNRMVHVVTGKDIEEMSDKKLTAVVLKGCIFARLQPLHKERIVVALQRSGLSVGFLGDGVNDCAALRAADVGVSVDTGLDVAKAAADVILVDKSLMTLQTSVRAGRKVFANVIKYIKMAASSNWGNMFSVLGASLFLPFVPMLPLQVVAGNLIYDFAQLSIPTDNVPSWHLSSPLHWDIGAIARFVLLLGPVSSIFDFLTFYLAYWQWGGREDPAVFRTAWFVEGILSQLFIVFVLRTAVPESAPNRVIPIPSDSFQRGEISSRSLISGSSTPTSAIVTAAAAGESTPPRHAFFLLSPFASIRSWLRGSSNRERGGPSVMLVVVTVLMGMISVTLTQIPVVGDELEFVKLPAQYWPWLLTIIVLYCSLTAGLMHTVLPRLLRFRRRSDSTRRRGGFRRNDDKKSAIKILVADKLN